MGAVAYSEHYTYDDYIRWDGDWELIDGHPYAMAPAPMITHQALAMQMAFELERSMEDYPECIVAPEVDWKISNDTVLRPDVVLICDEHNDAYLTKAPEIVVKVISKSTAKRDEKYKFEIYEREKVKYYILIYPDDLKAKVYKLDEKKFDKQGDFTKETFHFEDTACDVSVDFERVFRKFRKK